jgi:membrane protease YdiL (CAAX protease family)
VSDSRVPTDDLEDAGPAVPPGIPAAADTVRPPNRRVTALAEVLLCSGVPTQLLLGALLVAAGWAPTPSNAGALIVLLLADTCLLITMMVVFTHRHGERTRDLWLGTRPVIRETVLGIWLLPVVFVIVVVTLNLLRLWAPWLHNVPDNPLESLAGASALQAIVFGLVAILAGGVREELQRAFLLRRFERHLGGGVTGVIVLSVAFGLAHWVQGWDAAVTTGMLGALWALVYLRRRSIVAPVVSHAGFNALMVSFVGISA